MTTLTSSARRSSREGRVSVSGSRGLPPVCLSVSVSRQQPIPTHSKTEIECTVCAASTGACTDRVNRYNTLERRQTSTAGSLNMVIGPLLARGGRGGRAIYRRAMAAPSTPRAGAGRCE